MPIDIKVLHGGLRLLCRGVLTGDDLIGVHNRLLASPEVLKRSKYALVDEMAVDRLDVSTAELETVADLDKRLAAVAAAHAVIAIVAPRDLGFGLARMWEVFAEETGWETMTFRSVAEAGPWVCEKVKQNFGVDLAEEVKTASG